MSAHLPHVRDLAAKRVASFGEQTDPVAAGADLASSSFPHTAAKPVREFQHRLSLFLPLRGRAQ